MEANSLRPHFSGIYHVARKLVDEVVAEPLGGAHRDFDAVAEAIRAAVERHLDELTGIGIDDLLERRYRRIQSFGRYSERN